MRRFIVAAKIQYSVDGAITTLGVASGHYTADAAGLFRRTWYPILDPSVTVEIGVSLPWESGGPTDTFGAVQLTNGADGLDDHLLDTLLTAQVAGLQTEIRRGYSDEAWGDLELVSITHNDRLSFDGETVTISQRSALDKTDMPIVSAVFDDTTPNPRVVNKTVPLLLGPAFQVEPLIWDAPNGVYYVASNQSNISAVREGGALTDNFASTDWGFQMLAGTSLQLTADAIGPAPDSASTTAVVDWDFAAWTSGDPDSIDVTESTSSPFDATIEENSGGGEAEITVSATPTGDTGWVSLTSPFEPLFGSLSGNGDWSAVSAASPEEAVVADDGSYATATVYGETTLRVAGFSPAVPDGYAITGCEIELIADGTNVELTVLTVNQTNPGTRIASYIGVSGSGITASDITGTKTTHTGGGTNFIGGGIGVREDTDAEDVNPGCHFTLKFRPATAGAATLNVYQVRIKLHYAPSIDIVRLFSPTGVLEVGERHTITIEASAADIYARWGGSDSSGGALRDASDPFSTSLSKLDGPGRYTFEFVPESGQTYFGIEFKRLNTAGTATIDRIKVEKRADGKNRYKSLVPYIAELVGLEASAIDQTAIDQHDADTGSPEMGWYIAANESMAEVMDLFARSLSGVWWRDRDAKIRSALWSLDDAATPDYTIDSVTVDGIQQSIYIDGDVQIVSDPAPRATERAVGAKNWRPLRVNETAGITAEFNEQERANVIEDWRVRRRADFDSLNPWGAFVLALDSISPSSGDAAGGTSVTLTGTFDTGAASTDVTFGGTSGTNITVVNSTTITCDTPSGTAGDVDVVVDQDGETATLADGFEYTGATYADTVNADSPVGYWRLDETSGTTAADETGSYDGTYVGSAAINQSPLITTGRAAQFGTADSSVDIGAQVIPNNNTGFSIEAWVKPDNVSGLQYIFEHSGTSSNFLDLALSSGQVRLRILANDGSGDTPPSVSAGETAHIVVTWDGSSSTNNIKIYKNGVLEATRSRNVTSLGTFGSVNDVRIGARTSSGAQQFDGVIDEFAVYTSVLTASQISDHYNAGT